MRLFWFALAALLLAPTVSDAQSRYNTTGLSCSRIQSILRSEKVALLRFPSRRGNVVYDFYTFSTVRCSTGGRGRPASVPAADTKSCRVFRCERVLRNSR